MNWHFCSPISIDPWCWTDGETGIGGNENGVIEMSRRLCARGHQCSVYCRTPWGNGERWNFGVRWSNVGQVDPTQEGIWVLCRCAEYAALIPKINQQIWMIVQDFEHDWKAEYFDRIDRVLFTCQTHKDLICARHPHLLAKSCVTSNGVKIDLIEELEAAEKFERNPHKIMWASSPDRGLRTLLKIFARVREVIHDLDLHVFYGFNGIDRIVAQNPNGWPEMEKEKRLIMELAAKTPGVHMRGRVTQRELYRNWLTSGLMIYPTLFKEMSWISGREAQCMGAIPVVTPVWGQHDHMKHGVWVVGDPAEEMIQARFAGEILALLAPSNVGLREKMRAAMMADARTWCSWDLFVSAWEGLANG